MVDDYLGRSMDPLTARKVWAATKDFHDLGPAALAVLGSTIGAAEVRGVDGDVKPGRSMFKDTVQHVVLGRVMSFLKALVPPAAAPMFLSAAEITASAKQCGHAGDPNFTGARISAWITLWSHPCWGVGAASCGAVPQRNMQAIYDHLEEAIVPFLALHDYAPDKLKAPVGMAFDATGACTNLEPPQEADVDDGKEQQQAPAFIPFPARALLNKTGTVGVQLRRVLEVPANVRKLQCQQRNFIQRARRGLPGEHWLPFVQNVIASCCMDVKQGRFHLEEGHGLDVLLRNLAHQDTVNSAALRTGVRVCVSVDGRLRGRPLRGRPLRGLVGAGVRATSPRSSAPSSPCSWAGAACAAPSRPRTTSPPARRASAPAAAAAAAARS